MNTQQKHLIECFDAEWSDLGTISDKVDSLEESLKEQAEELFELGFIISNKIDEGTPESLEEFEQIFYDFEIKFGQIQKDTSHFLKF